jgi:hypothetical protein
MFWALLDHHQGLQLLYEMFAWYIGVLHVVYLLEILWYGIRMTDRIVHSKLEQFVVMLKKFIADSFNITTSTN